MSKQDGILPLVGIPDGLGRKFRKQLVHLVDQLSNQGFKGDYLRKEAFSKFLDERAVPGEVRKEAAIRKWKTAELRNAKTNSRLLFEEDFGWVETDHLIELIRSEIQRVIGPVVYPDVLMLGTFTNGASTRVPRSPAASVVKLTGEVHITESAIKHWLAMATGSRLSGLPLRVVRSSVLFTVPKKTEIDRVACKEPEGNMLLQRSAGIYLRKRLKKTGIDLLDQSRNQRLAQRAVKDGLATIDLSSASDTISRTLVMRLLPFDWWSLLDDLRVDSCLIGEELHELEMFSSMGNGFTFELETLIFLCVARAIRRLMRVVGPISVYGDDIICPSAMVPRLLRVFSWLGFIPNKKKTHYTGRFRESCGKHYWDGLDVTPFYLRKDVESTRDVINILNRLLEWDGRGWGFFSTREAYDFWLRWRDRIDPRLWGGIDPSDPTALVTGHRPRKRLVLKTREVGVDEGAALLSWLHRTHGREGPISDPLLCHPRAETAFVVRPFNSLGEQSHWDPGFLLDQDLDGEGRGVSLP